MYTSMSANNPCNLTTAHLPTPEATDFASSCRSLCRDWNQ